VPFYHPCRFHIGYRRRAEREGAPGECLLAKPKTAAPAGQYWLRLGDWLTTRPCWVLRAKLEPS
jgi:hypothetical protein